MEFIQWFEMSRFFFLELLLLTLRRFDFWIYFFNEYTGYSLLRYVTPGQL